LPGITREILLEALSESSVEVQEGKCSIKDFDESPSIWLTSSTKGLLPLKSVLGTKYILDQSNNKFKDIQNLFESAMKLHLVASE
jgi:branched-subunit amino acid aminotransferase/4-amino-4-deoxychorismate lyase